MAVGRAILLMSMPIRAATFWFPAVAHGGADLMLCTSQNRPAIGRCGGHEDGHFIGCDLGFIGVF